jgi:hypothetical protein
LVVAEDTVTDETTAEATGTLEVVVVEIVVVETVAGVVEGELAGLATLEATGILEGDTAGAEGAGAGTVVDTVEGELAGGAPDAVEMVEVDAIGAAGVFTVVDVDDSPGMVEARLAVCVEVDVVDRDAGGVPEVCEFGTMMLEVLTQVEVASCPAGTEFAMGADAVKDDTLPIGMVYEEAVPYQGPDLPAQPV